MFHRWTLPSKPLCAFGLTLWVAAVAAPAPAESLEESIRAVEIAFAESLARQDWEAFKDHIAEDAVFVANRPLVGKEAILAVWSRYFEEGAPKLTWRPEISMPQPSGQHGFSRGPYELVLTDAEGNQEIRTGEFISIWERQADGGWKIIFDTGCPACEECPTE